MSIFGIAKKGFGMLKGVKKPSGQKAINSVKPKVNKTKRDQAKSNLAIAEQKLKGSRAKLAQTEFEIKNRSRLTFTYQGGIKTPKNSSKKK